MGGSGCLEAPDVDPKNALTKCIIKKGAKMGTYGPQSESQWDLGSLSGSKMVTKMIPKMLPNAT